MTSQRDFPKGTVTFLFTDIEGSTRISQALGPAEYGALLERHRIALRGAFTAGGGVEVGTEGDSFFVVFRDARAAVVAALEAQRRIGAEEWPPSAEVRVRMGLHTGEGVVVEGTYVGNDVNRAARIAAAGHGGQVLASETTGALVGAALPDGTRLSDLGRHRLKDLQPERLWQVNGDGLPGTFPPIRSLDAHPNNLPTQLTTFVGREHEIAEAIALLETTRLLTMTGPGGTGKTRLSLQVAATVADRYPDGVFFVALEPVRDPALVAPRIAAAVGIVDAGSRPVMDQLVEWLMGRQVLFVLDNFEQVVAAAPVVADLLRACPVVKLIVTSRAVLRVSGEQEYPVPGLPVPPLPAEGLERVRLRGDERTLGLDAVGQYEAVKLFIARALAVRPGFTLTNENAPAVAAICARLHGMPLAIELAAARVKILGPAAILERLEHQLQLLAGGSRDLPERQQTLRGAIAWSYDLLDAGARRLVDRLSVFVGGFDLEDAIAVCGPDDEVGGNVLEGILALVDQSLVRTEPSEGDPRFAMFDTIREYAAERLEGRGEAGDIEARHTARYVDLVHAAAANLSGADQRTWLDRLEREHDNTRAALDRAVRDGDAGVAIPLAFDLWRFWQKRGHLPEARRRLDAIAQEPWSHTEPRLRARLMEALGGVAWWQADLTSMDGFYSEALDIWRATGDKAEIANALYNASFSYVMTIRADAGGMDPGGEGLRRLKEARDLFAAIGDERGVANAVWAIGNYDYFRAQGEHGRREFEQALEIFRRVGDRTMEAWSLHMLGSGMLRMGEIDAARDTIRQALHLFHDAGDAAGMALVLDDFSAVATAEGDLARAARIRGAARSLTSATGATLATYIEDVYEEGHRPTARGTMPADDLERFGAEGAAMSLDEAIAYALDEPVDSRGTDHEHPAGVR